MKVLILHQHFNTPYTGGAMRSYYLARALVSHGIHTIVITGHNDAVYKHEQVDGIEVHYLPVKYENRYGFIQRSISFMRYIAGAVRLAARFTDADVCYAMSVPLTIGIAARRIKSMYNIPYIFEVGDLWPEAPIQMGVIKNIFFKRALYALEHKIYASARSIVALSPAIAAAIKEKVPHQVIHQVPNVSDTGYFKPEPKDVMLERKFGVEGKLVVSYIGAIGAANGLHHFVQCARASAAAGLPVHFIMCGAGAMLASLTDMVRHHKLQNFSIIPFLNREGVREILNVTDASFISYLPLPVLETGSPNKFFDGLAAGKLIVVNFSGWIRNEIEQNRCGVYVNQSDAGAFVDAITPFIQSAALLKEYQHAARLLAEKQYSREALSKKFAGIFQDR